MCRSPANRRRQIRRPLRQPARVLRTSSDASSFELRYPVAMISVSYSSGSSLVSLNFAAVPYGRFSPTPPSAPWAAKTRWRCSRQGSLQSAWRRSGYGYSISTEGISASDRAPVTTLETNSSALGRDGVSKSTGRASRDG